MNSASKPVVIFGTGDLARVVHTYFTHDSDFQIAAFTANQDRITDTTLLGLDVVPAEELVRSHPPDQYAMFVAIGFSRLNKARAAIYQQYKDLGYELVSYVNSKAVYWGELQIGDNCFILEQNVIQPFVKIGSDVVLWSGNHIGHDSTIGDHCFLASHVVVSGNVSVGDYSFLGVNATIRDGVTIGPECLIGAGSLILRDAKPGQVFGAEGTKPSKLLSHQIRGLS
jgi:sugar O-acyltransferase (sialic acid O-acetyltransferase NeuD family)